jgi:hypothetical protein
MGRQGSRGDRQTGRTDRTGDRQGSRSDRQGNRTDTRGDRQDNRSDNQGDRQDNRNDRWDDRSDRMDDRQDFRQEAYDDHHGWGHGHHEFYDDAWKYAVGASLTAATFRALTCASRTVVVNGVSYYNCGPTWYNRAYSGGSTTYVVVNAPAGY